MLETVCNVIVSVYIVLTLIITGVLVILVLFAGTLLLLEWIKEHTFIQSLVNKKSKEKVKLVEEVKE